MTCHINAERIEIAGELLGESDKALRFFDGKVECWLPKSLAEWQPEDKVMEMPEWLATDRGFVLWSQSRRRPPPPPEP